MPKKKFTPFLLLHSEKIGNKETTSHRSHHIRLACTRRHLHQHRVVFRIFLPLSSFSISKENKSHPTIRSFSALLPKIFKDFN